MQKALPMMAALFISVFVSVFVSVLDAKIKKAAHFGRFFLVQIGRQIAGNPNAIVIHLVCISVYWWG